jgi:GIY-YIG catalytic domain.
MSRIRGISLSNFSRIAASFRAAGRRREVEKTIEENSSLSPNEGLEYSVASIEMNPQNRLTSIVITETTRYRTIDRYVTQNYVKYPVYSEIKTKTKNIRKSLKLSNEKLETLRDDPDPLISNNALEIVSFIQDEYLYPSWYCFYLIDRDTSEKKDVLQEEEDSEYLTFNSSVNHVNDDIAQSKNLIEGMEVRAKYLSSKKEKRQKKLLRIERYRASWLLDVITFGWHRYLRSSWRKKRVQEKLGKVQAKIDNLGKEIEQETVNLALSEANLSEINKKHQSFISSIAKHREALEKENQRQRSEVAPLDASPKDDKLFVPLRDFIGFDYRKITGCYVIRNKENGRCYVGQSKDVLRRLNQHFNGTIPKNPNFAEDYYQSNKIDKKDLFEVKIIPLSTKDELDRTEKELIALHDSFSVGYNKTSGND